MIRCRTVTTHHTDAREGKLSAAERFGYRLHMAMCPACRAYAKGLDQTVEALGELPAAAAPDAVKREALERLRDR